VRTLPPHPLRYSAMLTALVILAAVVIATNIPLCG
jgi:hypothetical protein